MKKILMSIVTGVFIFCNVVPGSISANKVEVNVCKNFSSSQCVERNLYDFDNDGRINVSDLADLSMFLTSGRGSKIDIIVGDGNRDGQLTDKDFDIFRDEWYSSGKNPLQKIVIYSGMLFDFDNNGKVDISDFADFIRYYSHYPYAVEALAFFDYNENGRIDDEDLDEIRFRMTNPDQLPATFTRGYWL